MTSPAPEKSTTTLVLQALGYTLGFVLAISNNELLTHLSAIVLGFSGFLGADKKLTIRIVPGVLLILSTCVLMGFLIFFNLKTHIDASLWVTLHPWSVSLMTLLWGLCMFKLHREWRTNNLS